MKEREYFEFMFLGNSSETDIEQQKQCSHPFLCFHCFNYKKGYSEMDKEKMREKGKMRASKW